MKVKQLICGSLNRMRFRRPCRSHTYPRLQQLGAGVCGVWSDLRVRDAVDFRETDGGEVREEIVVQNASGGKPGSHGSKVILLSHV